MVSKIMLRIDIIGQIIIMVIAAFSLLLEPDSALIIGLIFLFGIGCWQIFLGLIQTIVYRNKTRQKYLIAAFIFIASMIVLAGMNSWFTVGFDSEFLAYLTGFYIFGGATTFAIWYFRQTIKDLNRPRITRTFWDLEF